MTMVRHRRKEAAGACNRSGGTKARTERHQMSAVRHIAPAAEAPLVAVGAFEHEVAIWSVEPAERLNAFSTILDFGGRRLALTPDGSSCVAGAYHVHGIACYGSRDGSLRWERRDLKKVQSIRASLDSTEIYCFFEDAPGQRLQLATGKTAERLRAARDIDESPFSPIDLVHRVKLELRRRRGDLLFSIPRATFAVLSVAFSPTDLAVSESGGSVRFIDLNNGSNRWEYVPPRGHHVLRLGYCPADGLFYGVEWPYSRGGAKELLRFDPECASARSILQLGNALEAEFCLGGRFLVASDGTLIDLRSTSSVHIAFDHLGSSPFR